MKLDSLILLSEFDEYDAEEKIEYLKMLAETSYDEIEQMKKIATGITDEEELASDVDDLLERTKDVLDPTEISDMFEDLLSVGHFASKMSREDIYEENEEYLNSLAGYDAALKMQEMMNQKYDTQFREREITIEEYNKHRERSRRRAQTIHKHKAEAEGLIQF